MFSALLLATALAGGQPLEGTGLVAIQAGTIYTMDGGRIIEGGGTLVISDGKIVGVGKDVEALEGARVVDYGPDAVIIPGLIAVDSNIGGSRPSERTAEPGLSAADGFDAWSNYGNYLSGGVTTAYLAPARGRLIAGHGAVVKLGGELGEGRVISDSASIHGSISADARRTRGYWEPPVPATVDVGLGVERPQLPRTTMGAIVALTELLSLAGKPGESLEYGPYAGADLAGLIKEGTTWRMTAETTGEVRALVDFFTENGLPLVIDGAGQAGELSELLGKADIPVVVHSRVNTNRTPRDQGKGEESTWPDAELASKLNQAGVTVAVTGGSSSSLRDLRFHAELARKGGMSHEDALAAVTLNAARVLGVEDRVGSISLGKDADLVILNGPPLSSEAGVIATWVNGEVAYKSAEAGAVVLEVEELHVGNGEVLSPGQLLMKDGQIVEVGRRVSHPIGSTVVRGAAAMPGMIDTMGYLGLEGSAKVPQLKFKYEAIVEPGDFADRRVAQAGVTTVVLTPRGTSSSGAPAMAYKPAGSDLDHIIVADPAAVNLVWSNSNRLSAGGAVKSLMGKVVSYAEKWEAYEMAMAEWVPPAPEPKEEDEEEEDEEDDEDKDDEEDDEKDKKKKKKKKKGEEEPALPITGVWLAEFDDENGNSQRLRIQVDQQGTSLEGRLRCNTLSSSLVTVHGTREGHEVSLSGLGSSGQVTLSAKTEEEKLTGKVGVKGREYEFEAAQTSKEYVVAGLSERRRVVEEETKPPKGKPKSPGINPNLEPLRAALEGKVTIVVRVDRSDEILDCVDYFESIGVQPVLSGADEAWKVSDHLVGRVRGVLLDHRVIYSNSKMGLERRNRYAELANAGIRVAFHSKAEEGAAELPLMAAYAVSQGMSPTGALRALTSDAAEMMSIDGRVGSLRAGLDADVLLLDGDPLDLSTSVQRVWVGGHEVRLH